MVQGNPSSGFSLEGVPQIVTEKLSDLDILTQARKEFALADLAEKDIREEYDRCMRFIALQQWNEQRTSNG